MKIETVEVTNFRGIASTALRHCGQLNVLIGRNNSGKSTLLDSISGFFDMVSDGAPVQLESVIAASSNFRKTAGLPITVALTFALEEGEFSTIKSLVAAEAPQVRNALDSYTSAPMLRISVTAPSSRDSYAYIDALSLVLGDPASESRTLLSVPVDAAQELYQKARDAKRHSDNARDFERLSASGVDPEELVRYRDRAITRSTLSRYLPNGTSDDVYAQVSQWIAKGQDPSGFRQQMESLGRAAASDADEVTGRPLVSPVETLAGVSTQIPQYVVELMAEVNKLSALHLKDRREPVGPREAQRLLDLKVRRGGTEALRTIQETVQGLMGVAIDAFEGDVQPRSYARRFGPNAEMDVDEVLVEMNGSGIREALRLVLDNELTHPQVLLVEEPEVHLHPALEMSMLRYLQTASLGAQVFITTHSTNFLDASDVRNIYLVSRSPDVQAEELDYESARAKLPANLGLRLSSLLMYDHLVFVEGATDEAVVREFAGLLGHNLGRAGVGFVHMGGARNFSYFAAKSTLSTLTRRAMRLTFLIDRDEATPRELERLKSLVDSNSDLHVLTRREIENYLLVPDAICELINSKRSAAKVKGGSEATAAAIESALNAAAEALRSNTLERTLLREFARPAYIDREGLLADGAATPLAARLSAEIARLQGELSERLESFDEALVDATTAFESKWPGNALALAPGDEILTAVFKEYGVIFSKTRDSQRLATLIPVTAIDSELRNFIYGIVGKTGK